MNLWGPEFYSNDDLVTEIKSYAAARRKVRGGDPASIVRKIQGENRMIEFAPVQDSMSNLDADLREMLAEARRRGLPIGGVAPHAIAVETGL